MGRGTGEGRVEERLGGCLKKPYGSLFYKLPMCVHMKEFNWSDSTQGKTLLLEPQLPSKNLSAMCGIPQVAGKRCPRDPQIAFFFSLPMSGHRQSQDHIAAGAWKKSLMLMLDFLPEVADRTLPGHPTPQQSLALSPPSVGQRALAC